LHKEPSNIFAVTHSSNVKEGAIKIEKRKKYLPNYVKVLRQAGKRPSWK
jgi:hypothetical protein